MMKNNKNFLAGLLLAAMLAPPAVVHAQEQNVVEAGKDNPEETWNAKLQATYIWQGKPAINAPYSGANSVLVDKERGYSSTVTAFFGYRPWQGAEFYVDPEMSQAVALSGLHGFGGMTNSEQQKTSGADPTFYRARLYLKQTVGFGGGQDAVESGQNQLAGMVDRRRLVLTAGNLSVIDIFDNNAYAHDARTQFTNWTFLTHGAYDYAADARGYTWGAAAEYYDGDWAFRGGRFMVPVASNGLTLDTHSGTHYGDQIEVEHAHVIGDQTGKIKLLMFRNQAVMGSFADAIAHARTYGGVPDVANVRKQSSKSGYGISLEQSLRADVGLFARASWNDGKTENYSFTEIENSISTGVAVKGASWGREKDTFGLAIAQNGLNKTHREYLALGGLGAFIGDGQITYRPERIVEAYYSVNVYQSASVMAGLQHIVNPAYNADRGPVNVGTVRLHVEL